MRANVVTRLASRRSEVITRSDARALMWVFVALLAVNALDAYDLGRVPLQWIAQVAPIVVVGYVAFRYRLSGPLGYRTLWLLFLWSALITAANTALNYHYYASLMPPGATTSYPIFVSLRLLTQLSFIASLYILCWLLQQGLRDDMVKGVVILGGIVAIVAIYIYLAEVYGLPEPPRNRLGTSGAQQAVRFTYDFHRALGTFREPGLLAAWLIVPFFISLTLRQRRYYIPSILIAGTLLLTGSLSALLSIVMGLGAASVVAVATNARSLRSLVRPLIVLPFAIGLFYLVSVPSSRIAPAPPPTGSATPTPGVSRSGANAPTPSVNLFATIGHRIAQLAEGGLANSDRYVIYGYVTHNRPPILGTGLGNANLALGRYVATHTVGVSTPAVAGFISLYLNFLYSTGLVGVALLAYFLLAPVVRAATNGRAEPNGTPFVMAAYLAWLVTFIAGIEELSFMFAVALAFLLHQISQDMGAHARGVQIQVVQPAGEELPMSTRPRVAP